MTFRGYLFSFLLEGHHPHGQSEAAELTSLLYIYIYIFTVGILSWQEESPAAAENRRLKSGGYTRIAVLSC